MQRESEDSSDDSGFEELSTMGHKQSVDEEPLLPRPPTTPQPFGFERPEQPAIPLSGYGYSLVPDMFFGWRPKLVHGGPIPLLFNKCELPVAIDPLTEEEFPVIFHGFRPRDSMVMHQAFSRKEGYPPPNMQGLDVYEFLHRRDPKLCDTRAFVGMSPTTASDLLFDSTFESGNLDKVVQVGPRDYDLYMRADSNTKGYHQWYFFSTQNRDTQEVRFNIVNFTKNESLYSQGMQPVVYSEKRPELGWHRAGKDMKYRPSKINSLLGDRRKVYFSLTFTYRFEALNDKVYFAYAFPYTFSRLCSVLKELCGAEDRVRREVLCKSLSGVEVPMVVVTNFRCTQKKDNVIITARVHPGETHGSLMLEGLLRSLLGDSAEAISLREKLVFHIIPCLNPDGVILGNYRTGFAGNDLNRQFQKPDEALHPTVAAVKKMMERVKSQGKILAFLDLHAHSRKKSVFIYGPYYPLHREEYYTMRVLPKLICDQAPQFRYAACRFQNEVSKQQAARLVIWRELKLANSYTVEGSFYGYLTEDRRTEPFTEATVQSAGASIAKGLHSYVLLLESESHILEEKRKVRRVRHIRPAQFTANSPLSDVVNSIKAAESAADAAEETNCDSDDEADELSAEEQTEIHGKIVAVVEEFSSLARSNTRRAATKVVTSRGKSTGRHTPDSAFEAKLDTEKSVRRSGWFAGKRKPHIHIPQEMKEICALIPLPRMAEYRASRSVSAYKRKRNAQGVDSARDYNMSKYALESRRLIARSRVIDSGGEDSPCIKPKSPLPTCKPLFSLESSEQELADSASFILSGKSPMARITPTKRGTLLRNRAIAGSVRVAGLRVRGRRAEESEL